MFDKILIANRGEIALRIIRACKELGVKTVAVFSEPDVESLHVRFADEAVCIGPAENRQSYLNETAILSAARITGAQAVHPGYGFLAESAHFAEVCEECGINFIGPKAGTIREMGDKIAARSLMKQAGVPVIPGSGGPVESVEECRKIAANIGYPLLLKAAAGGGGRGIRIVKKSDQLIQAFPAAKREAKIFFNDDRIYLEKFLAFPRHVEIQIMGDRQGNIIHFGERDCSIQRRHQKILEEAPSPALDDKIRKDMGRFAVLAGKTINYENAGTVEFLLQPDGDFYFIEMNTRIQVEHPVTEMTTGINLIKRQILVAAGDSLPWRQQDIKINGHSIECRICAEDPRTFAPSTGRITAFNLPGGLGVRVDTCAFSGYRVLPHYDSMLAKLIVHGENRAEAVLRMKRCLEEFIIEGIETNISFHKKIVKETLFNSGDYSTDYLSDLQRFL